jgi:hypothetical protein
MRFHSAANALAAEWHSSPISFVYAHSAWIHQGIVVLAIWVKSLTLREHRFQNQERPNKRIPT